MLDDIILNYKARKVQKSHQYPLHYLFIGHYQRAVTEDDLDFTYCHYECFLANASKCSQGDISALKRITGIYDYNEPIPFQIAPDNNKNILIDKLNKIEYTLSRTLPMDFAQGCNVVSTKQHVSRTNIIKAVDKMNHTSLSVAKRLAMYHNPIQDIIDQEFGKK